MSPEPQEVHYTLADALDRFFPKRGQCGVCGVPGEDQRHRVVDAIGDRVRAGDTVEDVAEDFGVGVVAVCVATVATMPEPSTVDELRSALNDALEGLEDMAGFMPRGYREKVGRGYVERAREALGLATVATTPDGEP